MIPVIYNFLSWLIYLVVVGTFTAGGFYVGMMMERERSNPNNSNPEALYSLSVSFPVSYEDHLNGIAMLETRKPVDFLKIRETSSHSGLFSSSVTVDCWVNNWAFVTSYKDIEFEITCLSKTGVPIERIRRTAYEAIPAQSQKKVSVKFDAPDQVERYSVRVVSAVEGG